MAKMDQKQRAVDDSQKGALQCGLPIIPDRPLAVDLDLNRASLIRYIEKKWVNHTAIHFHFLDKPRSWKGANAQKQVVRDSFQEWHDLGLGLEFIEVGVAQDAELRIAFEPGGSWSYVGRDAINLVPSPKDRTMNFGWNLTTSYGRDTARHEIGHALGFPHEHQNPNAGILWDEEAVNAYFQGPPNYWDTGKIFHNIIRKISPSAVGGSQWDPDSIMHYQFDAGLILTPQEYQTHALIPDPGLSPMDIAEAIRFYPGDAKQEIPELKPYLSQLVEIEPGEQLDFLIQPSISRKYTIQTFGPIDAVIVLFEEVDGEPVFMAGDDDSGTNLNAKIEERLIRGRKYYLRFRLYYEGATGQGAVMVW